MFIVSAAEEYVQLHRHFLSSTASLTATATRAFYNLLPEKAAYNWPVSRTWECLCFPCPPEIIISRVGKRRNAGVEYSCYPERDGHQCYRERFTSPVRLASVGPVRAGFKGPVSSPLRRLKHMNKA
jgi:hypothetical protein